jgi:glycosidase
VELGRLGQIGIRPLAGVTSKLEYLKKLGITAMWLSPVFRQRARLDTYHGYGIQDFLDVDPLMSRYAKFHRQR